MNEEIKQRVERLIDTLNYNGVKCSTAWSVYDFNAHTIQELICQVFSKVNEIVNIVNDYTLLIKSVLEWIKNEGLQQAVKEELDRMEQDGTLAEIINEKLFNDLNNKIDEVSNLLKESKTELENKINEVNTNLEGKIEEVENLVNGEISTDIEQNKNDIKFLKDTKDTTTFYILNNTKVYGDCIVIHADDGSFSMIDTGWNDDYLGFISQLDKIGVKKLKYLFITHDHSDHIGNAPRMIEKYRPEKLVCKGGIDYDRLPEIEKEWNTKGYHDAMIQACQNNGVEIIYAKDTDEYLIGKTDTIKPYNSTFYDYQDLNGMSITYILKSQNTYACFTGDSNARAENNIINVVPQCDFLKLSHHGGVGGNQLSWIRKVKPRYGFINRLYNVGANNTMKDNGVKVVLVGGTIYTNDNNCFGTFKISQGYLYPTCNDYKIPLYFIEDGEGQYKMTDSSGHIATNGIYEVNNKLYLVKTDGFLAKDSDDWVTFQGYQYIANPDNSLKRNEWVKRESDQTYYWVDDKGRWLFKPSIVYDKNELYIINQNGTMVSDGKIDFNGNYYYCKSSGQVVVDDWYETSEGYVYANAQGHLVSGRYFIRGRWYTFNDNHICTNPNNGEPPDYITPTH